MKEQPRTWGLTPAHSNMCGNQVIIVSVFWKRSKNFVWVFAGVNMKTWPPVSHPGLPVFLTSLWFLFIYLLGGWNLQTLINLRIGHAMWISTDQTDTLSVQGEAWKAIGTYHSWRIQLDQCAVLKLFLAVLINKVWQKHNCEQKKHLVVTQEKVA